MSKVNAAIAALLFALAFGAVGNADYADEVSREAEERLARPFRYYLIENSTLAATPAECRRALAHLAEQLEVVMTVNVTRDGVPWFRRTCLVAS